MQDQYQDELKAKEAAKLEAVKVTLAEIEKTILPVINKWIETRSLYHVTPEDQMEGKRIWDNFLFPGGHKASIGCQDCAKEIFTAIIAFYNRHTNRIARAEEQGLRSDPIMTVDQIDAQRAANNLGIKPKPANVEVDPREALANPTKEQIADKVAKHASKHNRKNLL